MRAEIDRGRKPVSDDDPQSPSTQFHYHLELTPAQLKITYTALHSLLDDFGHEESDVMRVIHEVLAKLPDEHAIRAIQLDRELERELGEERPGSGPSEGGSPPPTAA
jgi:hypothetical protein